jgi:uncharacterized membrane protein YebE (DUF533 family)
MNEIIRRIFNTILSLSLFLLAVIVLSNGLANYNAYKKTKQEYEAQQEQDRKDAVFNSQQEKHTQELTTMTQSIIKSNNANGIVFTQETLKAMQDDNVTDQEMDYLRDLHHKIITNSLPASSPAKTSISNPR